MIVEQYAQWAEMAIASVEGIKRTGIKALDLEPGRARMLMPLIGNINHVGMMYAGSLFTLGEITGGILHIVSFDVTRYYPIVKEVTIRFRRPALTDVTMEVTLAPEEATRIQAEAEERGKADFSLNVELKDASGEVVSLVSGIWQIRKIPAQTSGPATPSAS